MKTRLWGSLKKSSRCVSVVAMALFLLLFFKVEVYAASEREGNDTRNTAENIALNEELVGCMQSSNDQDYYKVIVPASGFLSLDIKNDYGPKLDGWTFELLMADDTVLYSKNVSLRNEDLISSPKYGVGKGTYYIHVSGYSTVGKNYSIKVNYKQSNEWEQECNDQKAKANTIALDTSCNGNIYHVDDVDYYKVSVPEAGVVRVDFSNEYHSNLYGWNIKLLSSGDNELFDKTVRMSNEGVVSSDNIQVAAGDYYVRVQGSVGAFQSVGKQYTVKVHYEVPNANVKKFVQRLYKVALDREPDAAGLADWTNRLTSGQAQAVNIVQGIMCSPEYLNKGKSNGEIVNDCYKAMLGRDADEGGYNDWVTKLNNGMTVNAIFAGFVGSQEFTNLCNSYGIQPGTYAVTDPRDQNQGVTAYVSRLYTQALGRGYDPAGLSDWCGRILANPSRENIVDVAATGFFHSDEFQNKGLNNEEYVKVLYRTFLGRECDPNGLADWVGQLDCGEKTRDEILPGFANSQEFSNIMAQYGL